MSQPTIRYRPNATSSDPLAPPFSAPSTSPKPANPPESRSLPADDDVEGPNRISLLDILRVLAGLFLLNSTLSYFITGDSITWSYRPPFTHPARIRAWLRGPLNLTDAQLALYNGTDPALPILLALNGTIYDVSTSPHLYGPAGPYYFFSGREATRAFVTGCFDSDLTGDLRGVEEMFVPTDLTKVDVEGLGRKERRAWKVRREREVRRARRRVREVVSGWERMFEGGEKGYFRVGRVERGVGSEWEGWGEVRELCEKAKEGRPGRTAEEVA